MSIVGCDLETLDGAGANRWLARVLGEPDPAPPAGQPPLPGLETKDLAWLLAYCDDGVVWGRRSAPEGAWRLSSAVTPELCPPLGRHNLQQLRLFGETSEVLLWRTPDGFRGRRLRDTAPPAAPSKPASERAPEPRGPAAQQPLVRAEGSTAPADESRVLVGNRLLSPPAGGFSHVRDADGREQVVPLECREEDFPKGFRPLRLDLRHYFERDPDSGAVRVVTSRLVRVYVQGARS